MSYRLFQYGSTGRSIYVDDNGSLVVNNDPLASGFIFEYGDEGHPLLVDASGRLLIQNDSPTSSLAALSDTNVAGVVSGQFLMYDGGTGKWVPADLTLDLGEISDVILTAPASGETLVYDGTNWVNEPAGAAGDSNPYDVSPVAASGQTILGATGKTYSVDLSGGDLTVNMPASPSLNDYIHIKDRGTSQTNSLLVSGNGNNIDGKLSHLIASNYASITLVWDSSEWIIL